MTTEIQKTHFADDDTLAYISRLERDRAELIEALRKMSNHTDQLCESVQFHSRDPKKVRKDDFSEPARALLSRLGAA